MSLHKRLKALETSRKPVKEGKIDLSTWTYEELKIAEKWLESGESTPLPEELKHLIEL
jgi:hypothetical protein